MLNDNDLKPLLEQLVNLQREFEGEEFKLSFHAAEVHLKFVQFSPKKYSLIFFNI